MKVLVGMEKIGVYFRLSLISTNIWVNVLNGKLKVNI